MESFLSASKTSIKKDHCKLDVVAEELDHSSSANNTNYLSVKINPLPLEEILLHVNKFGMKLDNLESKITENKYFMPRLNDMQSGRNNSVNGNGSNQQQVVSTSVVQGVQGGIDSQSLETILELKDVDLGAFGNMDARTSRLNSQMINDPRGSSSLSNFVLPQ
jgi:hypothetical protein